MEWLGSNTNDGGDQPEETETETAETAIDGPTWVPNLEAVWATVSAHEASTGAHYVAGSQQGTFGRNHFPDDTKKVLRDGSGPQYISVGRCYLHCHAGKAQGKKRKMKSTSLKVGCPAKIHIQEILAFPDLDITTEWRTRKSSQTIRSAVSHGTIPSLSPKRHFIIQLPSKTDHSDHALTKATPGPELRGGKRQRRPKVNPSFSSVPGCVLTVGEGDTGQLGLGPDVMEKGKPGKVALAEVSQICSGGMHTVCLTSKGEVCTFGCNDEGALGRPTPDEDDCMEPGKVNIGLNIKVMQISAGDSHTAALSEEGKVYAWGTFRDANGQIGLTADGQVQPEPVELFSEVPVAKISSGTDHLVCLTTDGQIYTLGCAEQGQLGRVAECFSVRGGRKGVDLLLTPAAVHCQKRNLRFTNVWTGQYMTFVQAETGDIYTWGLNNYYQLGLGDMENRFVPEKCKAFSTDKNWKEISGGQHHTLALDSEGHVYSLGRKEYGRLGLGENMEETKEPTRVKSLNDHKCVHVDAGTAVSFAITENGEVYGWGMGTTKQLGQGDNENDMFEPIKMQGKQLESRKGLMVSAGGQHTAILAADK